MPDKQPDVLVIGGGVIGLSIAWRCARSGLRATVVDESGGRGASWAAAGLLAPVTEAHYGEEELLRLNLASAHRYTSFISELETQTGAECGYRRCGTLVVARDRDDKAALDDLFAFQDDLGLKVERLTATECRNLEPALSPRTRGGLLVEGDHQIDNRAFVSALLDACSQEGVEMVRDRVVEIRIGSRAEAAVTANGIALTAGAFVLAAGAAVADVAGLPSQAVPPVRPVKGQLLHLRGPGPLLQHNVRGLDVYLVPRADGRLVVGATVEEGGHDLTRSAEGAYLLLRDAFELVPGTLDLEFVEQAVGLRPATPDNAPLIGASAVDGLLLATGHFRNGVLLAPITAEAITSLVTTEEMPHEVVPFSPLRFGGARAEVTT